MIKSNVGQFEVDLAKVIAKAKKRGNMLARSVAFALTDQVIAGTPVDKGTARNRWSVGLNSISTEEHGADRSGGQARTRALAKLREFKTGDTIFITNNLPYIRQLEYGLYGKPPGSANGPKTTAGYSTQAQQGFIRLTFLNVQKDLKRIAAQLP